MNISAMKLHSIAIADPPLRSSYGLHAPYALRTIVELTTDDGLTGISETYGGDGPLAALEAARDRVVGMDPFRLAGLYQDAESARCGIRRSQPDLPGARAKIRSISMREPSPQSRSRASTSSAKQSASRFAT